MIIQVYMLGVTYFGSHSNFKYKKNTVIISYCVSADDIGLLLKH